MKKFRAFLAAMLILTASLTLCACGKKDKTEGVKEKAFKTQKQGVLTMATNAEFPPYEYVEEGKIVGIDAEVAKLIADKLGLKLEIKDVSFDSIIPGVQTGKYDIGMAGMTVDSKRMKSVDFTSSYAKGVQAVIVLKDSKLSLFDEQNTALKLDGKRIGVQQGTTGDIYASDDFGETAEIIKFDNGAVAVRALLSGKVDCVIIDNEPAKAYVSKSEGLKLLDTPYVEEEYAICVSKKNPELTKAVDEALDELRESGKLQEIIDKYICESGEEAPAK